MYVCSNYFILYILCRVCETVKQCYKSFLKELRIADMEATPVFAAMIKEKTTEKDIKKRFTTVIMASGIAHDENHSCDEPNYRHTCAGHAEAICYHLAHVYLAKQIEFFQTDGVGVLSQSVNKEGFHISPEYKFHLFTTHLPCGFIAKKSSVPTLSWITPFTKNPHVIECSPRILINSYLGIQGPLTHLFARPVYIDNVIILTKQSTTSLNKISLSIPDSDVFAYHGPNIIMHDCDPKTIFEHHENIRTSSSELQGQDKAECITSKQGYACYALIPVKGEQDNTFPPSYKLEKKKEALEPSSQNKPFDEIPLWNDDIVTKEACKAHYENLKDAMRTLADALKVDTALDTLKQHIDDCLNDCQTNIKNNLVKMNELVDEQQYKKFLNLCNSTEKIFEEIQKQLSIKSKQLLMREKLDELIKKVKKESEQKVELLDCCWNRYCKKIKDDLELK